MGQEGNTLGGCAGKGEDKPAKEPKKLVRIGSRYFSKDTHTERKLNFGIRVEKAPSGVAFRTQNELVTDKQRVYNPVNRLPTYPGEEPKTEEVPLPLLPVEEESRTLGYFLFTHLL